MDGMDVPTEKLAKAMKDVLTKADEKPSDPQEKILHELQLLRADMAKEAQHIRFSLGLLGLLLLVSASWLLVPKAALFVTVGAVVVFVVLGFINRKRY